MWMRPRGVVGILLVGLLLSQIAAAAYCQASHRVEFYIFGSMGCPHCRDLKERLTARYGEGAVVFREVGEPENGRRLVALYSIIYPEIGDMAVPLTVIVIDGEPAGSVIGAMPDDFWEGMIHECLRSGKFMIFDGGALYAAERDPAVMRQISEIIGLAPSASASAISTSSSANESSTAPATAPEENPGNQPCPGRTLTGESAERSRFANYGFMIAAAVLLAAILALRLRRRRLSGEADLL